MEHAIERGSWLSPVGRLQADERSRGKVLQDVNGTDSEELALAVDRLFTVAVQNLKKAVPNFKVGAHI